MKIKKKKDMVYSLSLVDQVSRILTRYPTRDINLLGLLIDYHL